MLGKIATSLRRPAVAGAIIALTIGSATAQFFPSPPPPATPARGQACPRLEAQLAAIDRGGDSLDPARADQIKRSEDAAAKQQAELDRLGQQSQKLGCTGGGFLSMFGGQSPQCGPLNNQIQQVRAKLDQLLSDRERLQGNSGEREAGRRSVLIALGQNDCGPQYRQYASAGPGGFFESLFGGIASQMPNSAPSGTYRTLCVRTCDGYYFPISYATVPNRFVDDEQQCRRLCPAAEVALYSYRNPGEDVANAVSTSGRRYSDLPAAFSYRRQLNPACNCRAPGQSWAQALRQGEDQTIERGDIVVTEERARQLSQPRADAQGKPSPGAKSGDAAMGTEPLPADDKASPAAEEPAAQEPGQRKVRSVGPAFYPVR